MALTTEEKQEILDVSKWALDNLVQKYNKMNTKFQNFQASWSMTPSSIETDLSSLTDAQLLIRFRTGRKIKAEIDNIVGEYTHRLTDIDAEIMRRGL